MPHKEKKTSRGPMVHIRLSEEIHRDLKILAARQGTTIKKLVEGLIRSRVTGRSGSESRITG